MMFTDVMSEPTTILIADDEMHVIKRIVEILADYQYDYKVLTVPNGKILCEIAEKKQPQLILTDWDMPEMNGIEALQKLKENPKTAPIPVVMITGAMTSPSDLKLALDSGAFDYLHKPFHATELIARMSSALRHALDRQEIIKQREILENALNYYNLQVIAKNQVLNELKTDLKSCQGDYPEAKDRLLAMNIRINQHLHTDREWYNFRRIFEAVHPDFFRTLDEQYPQLSNKEQHLCALIRLRLDTSEITQVLGISAQGVRTAIYRIGKKMQLPKDIDPRVYLRQL